MLSAGFNLVGKMSSSPKRPVSRDGRTEGEHDQQEVDDHSVPIQRIPSRQKIGDYDPFAISNTGEDITTTSSSSFNNNNNNNNNNNSMPDSRAPSKTLSWTANRQPQRIPTLHKRAFSVNQTNRSLPSVPDLVLSSSLSSLSSSPSRSVYVLPHSKFSSSHARPRTAEQREHQILPPPVPNHPARSMTDSNLEDHRARHPLKESEDAFGTMALVGSLPSPASFKPRVVERANTTRDLGSPVRSNATRPGQPPTPRRFDFKRKDLPIKTTSSVRPPPPPPLSMSQQPQPSTPTASNAPPPALPSTPPALLPAPAIGRSPPQTRKERKAHRKTESGGRNRLVSGKRIAENVAEIFSSFKRIEADEMLSPEGLRQMKELRELHEAQRMERQKSWETVRSEASVPLDVKRSSTPPAAAAAAAMPPPGLRESPRSSEDSTTALNRRRASIDTEEISPPSQPSKPSQQPPSPDSDSMIIHVYACHSPTASSQPVFRPELTPLPSIPQLRVTSPEGEQQRPNMIPRKPVSSSLPAPLSRLPALPSSVVKSKPKRKPVRLNSFKPSENDDFVFFKSNPCTLTMPTFRHGDIRFAKADKDPKLGADENMDWTAFQMAILGGAGEFDDFNGPGDDEIDHDLSADMKMWFSSFGFSGPGRLVTDEELSQTPSTTASYSPVSSSASISNGEDYEADDDEAEVGPPEPLEITARSSGPVMAFDPTSFWNRADFEPIAAKLYSPSSMGMKRWTTTASITASPALTRKSLRRDSIESLPQSPMMPLVATHNGSNARDVDVVPMGYNLGHDLGDFLKWEAEQMYAGSFYGL